MVNNNLKSEKKMIYEVENAAIKLLHIVKASNEENVKIDNCIESGYMVVNEKGKPVDYISKNAYLIFDRKHTYDLRIFNNTFHKNFYLTKHMSNADYYRDQIMHYFSTYGLEILGFGSNPYIPYEELNIGDLKIKKNIVVYVALEKNKFNERIKQYITSIKAPRFDNIEDLKILLNYSDVKASEIKSFELKCLYYDVKNIIPKTPVDFLRYMIYKVTGQTLVIKNNELITAIKYGATESFKRYEARESYKSTLYKYFEKADLKDLASIFFRYKSLFLAFKSYDNMPKIINKIRKLANKYHKPLSDVCIQNVIKLGRDSSRFEDFMSVLKQMTNADIIKCINFLQNDFAIKAYTIRNNKTFVKEDKKLHLRDGKVISTFMDELKYRLKNKFQNKTFLLPSYMEYAVPTSEKQMLYNVPYGSYVKLGSDNMTLGVAWNNIKKDETNNRVDIDLHLFSKTQHLGWNSNRMNQDAVYTGDMTDATNGAAEAYWLNNTDSDYIATCNLYSGAYKDVSFKFFATKVKPEHFNRNYTYDPENELFPAIDLKFDQNNTLNLGLYTDGKFYFYGNTISSGIIPAGNYKSFIDAIKGKLENTLTMSSLIDMLGGKIIYDKIEDETDVVNLLPENITPDTLVSLINNK